MLILRLAGSALIVVIRQDPVILHFNHVSGGTSAKSLGDLTGLVVGSIVSLVEQGAVDAQAAPVAARAPRLGSLQDQLPRAGHGPAGDQFRRPAARRSPRSPSTSARPIRALMAQELASALQAVDPELESAPDDRVHLDDFKPWRDSIIWRFNRLFWQRLDAWEAASGTRLRSGRLPSGQSDANHPQAVADSVADFWTLLRDLRDPRPAAGRSLRAGDRRRLRCARRGLARSVQGARRDSAGTGYYARLRFLLGDYSDGDARARADGGRRPRAAR